MAEAPWTWWRGYRFDRQTISMIEAAERLAPKGSPWNIYQGSFNSGGVKASAGTHDGGGAVDISPYNWAERQRALRAVGFAAWHRPTLPGWWGEHIHCVAIGDPLLSGSAARQVTDYYHHRDGLRYHGWDGGWRPNPITTWSKYRAAHPTPIIVPGRNVMYSADPAYTKEQPLTAGKWTTITMSDKNVSVLWEGMAKHGAVQYSVDARLRLKGLPGGSHVLLRSRWYDTKLRALRSRRPVPSVTGADWCQYVEPAGKLQRNRRLRIQVRTNLNGVSVIHAGCTVTYWKD